jgi:TolB-like protein/Flp pilus assembly protein TadD
MADIVFPLLGWSDRAVTMVLVIATLGFPVVLALSWVYDLSGGLHVTETREPLPTKPLSTSRLLEIVLIFGLVLTVGYLYFDRFSPEEYQAAEHAESDLISGSSAALADKSVAVLPFVIMGGNQNYEYFGDGLAEEILNLLARVGELKVAARTSSFQFKNRNVDLREVAQALDVRYVLEGSIRLSEQAVRVTAQFIDARSGYHLWSETYDRKVEDIFNIQDDIARRVVTELQVILTPEQGSKLAAHPTDNVVAYQFYLEARELLRDGVKPENLDIAVGLLENAIAEDASFAAAYAGLCDAYLNYFTLTRDSDLFDQAEHNCRRALSLDSTASDVYVALGNLYIRSGQGKRASEQFEAALSVSPKLLAADLGLARSYELRQMNEQATLAYQRVIDQHPNDWQARFQMGNFLFMNGQAVEAIPHYSRAMELAPDNADAVSGLGVAWFQLGDFERAAEALQNSLAISPTAIAYSNTGTSYFYLGRFEDAAEMYRRGLELSPEDFELWGSLGDAYLAAGDKAEEAGASYRKAIGLTDEMLRINPEDAEILALTAHYHARLDERASAKALIARIETMASDSMYVYYSLALARASLGEIDASVSDLSRALDLGYPRQLLAVDPGLSALVEMTEFQALTEQ